MKVTKFHLSSCSIFRDMTSESLEQVINSGIYPWKSDLLIQNQLFMAKNCFSDQKLYHPSPYKFQSFSTGRKIFIFSDFYGIGF